MRSIIDWWGGLPWWLRLGVAGVFLLSAAGLLLLLGQFWPWGARVGGVGLVLLLFAFPSSAERKGYHDF
jgi:hypothetical protein